jgi:hypothetical protein
VLRWNPSPFEREGVPGLGWTVQPASSIPAAASVRLEMRADHLLLPDGTSIFFTDEDDDGDLFTFCPVEDGKPRLPDSIEATSASEVRVKFTDVSVDVTARRRSDEKFTRLSLRVVNSRENHRLRLWFELPSSPEHTTALSPFEVVRRPLIGEGFESEIGSATWPARGAVLAASTAVFSEGVVEYEVDRNRLGVTLLRAAGILAKPTLATRPIWAGPPTPTPGGQCLGTYDIELAILTDASEDQLHDEWERFALPLLEIPTAGGGGETPRSMLNVAGAHLSAVRRVATGVEVRVWNEHSEPCVTVVNGHSLEVRGAGIATIILEH